MYEPLQWQLVIKLGFRNDGTMTGYFHWSAHPPSLLYRMIWHIISYYDALFNCWKIIQFLCDDHQPPGQWPAQLLPVTIRNLINFADGMVHKCFSIQWKDLWLLLLLPLFSFINCFSSCISCVTISVHSSAAAVWVNNKKAMFTAKVNVKRRNGMKTEIQRVNESPRDVDEEGIQKGCDTHVCVPLPTNISFHPLFGWLLCNAELLLRFLPALKSSPSSPSSSLSFV